MKGNKMIMAIAAIVLVAALAMAAFVVLSGDDDKTVATAGEDTYCWVYGNANMDNRVDEDDIEYLKLIISGEKKETKYADANQDEVIDEKDIQVVRDIIDGKGGKRYYTMDNGEVGWITGQIKSLGAQYYANMYALGAMGATGIVTCADDETAKLANNGEFGKQVQSQKLKNYGYTGTYEPETLLSMKCDAILCGTKYFKNWESQYWDDDTYIAFIRLACWKTDPAGAILTVANLLENKAFVDQAVEYVEYTENINKQVEDAVSKLGEKKSILLIYPYKDGRMEFQGPGTGCYEASLMAGLNNLASSICDGSDDGGFHIVDLETALKYNPDGLIILKGSSWSSTQQTVDDAWDTYIAPYLKTLDAVKDGNVWFTSWRFTQGAFQPIGALMMASAIYGSDFGDVDPLQAFQEYVDKFTSINLGVSPGSDGYLDVTKTGIYFNKSTHSV